LAATDFDAMEDSNRSSNPTIHELSDPGRRTVLRGTLGVAAAALYGPLAAGCAGVAGAGRDAPQPLAPTIGFKGIPVDASDKLVVPDGYIASVIAAWGEPIGVPGNMPAWKPDGSNSAAEQAVQMGMHHDGMEYFALNGNSSTRGLLAMNHEYTDDGLLHVGGFSNMNADKVKKSQAAHGLSVIEVELKDNAWQMVPAACRWTRRSRSAARPPATR
jgi:secreted PhoX family phosphatase